MPWNWELPEWPKFVYDSHSVLQMERRFLVGLGSAFASLKAVDEQEVHRFVVEILSLEGEGSSKIEGEILDRESLQSSIQQQLGLKTHTKLVSDKESGMARLLCDVYRSFAEPLTHEMLWQWHSILFAGSLRISDCGTYRSHPEPMEIVSNRYGDQKVFFEAPPSKNVFDEMTAFIEWFNSSNGSDTILGKAAISHVYFESIHPFEDGNGRIGRLLVEKVLSRSIGQPILVAISKTLEKRKKEYYSSLERCNRTMEVQPWVDFFASVIVQAYDETLNQLYFLIEKSKMLNALGSQLNPRQIKALLRMFAEGPSGFKGGLTSEKYMAITKTSRATTTRDLNDLVKKGALVKFGERRYARYQLNLNLSINGV